MKKALFATAVAATALAGAAYAEDGVKLSGYGRFGLNYYDYDGNEANTTMFAGRLRFNIDASKTTDSGVTFGGRIRLQWDQGDDDADLSPAMMYVSYGGLRVEVGNANTAFDAAALLYGSEIGFQSRSFGDPIGDFFAFASAGRGSDYRQYVGIYASYSVGDFTGRVSYAKPDQTDTIVAIEDANEAEIGISGDYTFGNFVVSAAAVQNGAGIENNDMWFIGGAWSSNGLTVGLNYQDAGELDDIDQGSMITLYGSKTFGAFGVAAYVAQFDSEDIDVDNETVFGLGGSYDLGGAKLSAAIESGFAEGETRGDLGIRFDF